jgi:hypothetical protein
MSTSMAIKSKKTAIGLKAPNIKHRIIKKRKTDIKKSKSTTAIIPLKSSSSAIGVKPPVFTRIRPNVKIAIGCNSMSMNYDSFNSMNQRRILLGGVIYQVSEDLQSLLPLKYCPQYQDRNGCASGCAFMSVDGLTCGKVGGEISLYNRVIINNKEFIEQACTESYNNDNIPIGTRILVPKII